LASPIGIRWRTCSDHRHRPPTGFRRIGAPATIAVSRAMGAFLASGLLRAVGAGLHVSADVGTSAVLSRPSRTSGLIATATVGEWRKRRSVRLGAHVGVASVDPDSTAGEHGPPCGCRCISSTPPDGSAYPRRSSRYLACYEGRPLRRVMRYVRQLSEEMPVLRDLLTDITTPVRSSTAHRTAWCRAEQRSSCRRLEQPRQLSEAAF